LACDGGTNITVTGNNSTFCSSTTFTSDSFNALGTTTYWLSYSGDYLQIFHMTGNSATRSQSCQSCNNNTPTPTATPTPTPTPIPGSGYYDGGYGCQFYTYDPGFPTCDPNATPTPTPVTTSYDYYEADVYSCSDCGRSTETILVAFDAGSSVINNRFYISESGPDGNSYRILGPASSGIAYKLTTDYGSFTSCGLACFT
jgi:hypothetical protein